MSISLTVLNHLGIGLYSNAPAVLSELVANCWDADAHTVRISIDVEKDVIEIEDDGRGMSRDDINSKYLTVGYQKRQAEGATTPEGRHVMGRKGIGKLSVFSIAQVVDVYSFKDGSLQGLRLDRNEIKRLIRASPQATYRPDPLSVDGVSLEKGTRIVMRSFDKKINWAESYLRKRLARRFSIIGALDEFEVMVNGSPITPADRDYYKQLEFVWYFGEKGQVAANQATEAVHREGLDDAVTIDGETKRVSGWIGTVTKPDAVDDVNNAVVVLAHGKLVHEDILPEFQEAGVYADYVIGEINADFLDSDDDEDIITSGRQAVKVDDPRYQVLSELVQTALKTIKGQWTELRKQRGKERALQNPVLKEWYERLRGDNRKYAERLFGKIESLKLADEESKIELYRASLLAFEKLALRNTLSILDGLERPEDFDVLTGLFSDVDDLEATHYYEILRGRLDVLRQFIELLPESKERALQAYIFQHLWLLHPSWERAATNARIEEAVTTEFEGIDAGLRDDERRGRIDIRYRTAAGKHIIIELKKYDRKVRATDLVEQLRKYRAALKKCLETRFPEEPTDIEIISILGTPPTPENEPQSNRDLLKAIGARWVTYDQLIKETMDAYGDYLEKQREVSDLVDILDRLAEGFGVEDSLRTPSNLATAPTD
jgi:hypothetical protein